MPLSAKSDSIRVDCSNLIVPNHSRVAQSHTLLAVSSPLEFSPVAEALLADCICASGAPGTGAAAAVSPAADVRFRVSVKGSATAGRAIGAGALGVLASLFLRICSRKTT